MLHSVALQPHQPPETREHLRWHTPCSEVRQQMLRSLLVTVAVVLATSLMGGCIVHNHYRTEAPLPTPEPQQFGPPGAAAAHPQALYAPAVAQAEPRCERRHEVESFAAPATPLAESSYGPVRPRDFVSDDPADWLE